MRSVPTVTRLAVLSVLLASCGSLRAHPYYKVEFPVLGTAPTSVECPWKDPNAIPDDLLGEPCVLLLERDYHALVRELRATCIALGNKGCK